MTFAGCVVHILFKLAIQIEYYTHIGQLRVQGSHTSYRLVNIQHIDYVPLYCMASSCNNYTTMHAYIPTRPFHSLSLLIKLQPVIPLVYCLHTCKWPVWQPCIASALVQLWSPRHAVTEVARWRVEPEACSCRSSQVKGRARGMQL